MVRKARAPPFIFHPRVSLRSRVGDLLPPGRRGLLRVRRRRVRGQPPRPPLPPPPPLLAVLVGFVKLELLIGVLEVVFEPVAVVGEAVVVGEVPADAVVAPAAARRARSRRLKKPGRSPRRLVQRARRSTRAERLSRAASIAASIAASECEVCDVETGVMGPGPRSAHQRNGVAGYVVIELRRLGVDPRERVDGRPPRRPSARHVGLRLLDE
mmetsp:Transcript_13662/g.59617  ORF Transcript_13662/g.59617 Transcript_13662/m.59617 type:complete len:212 (-) Transcript_13662:848-1483(-)